MSSHELFLENKVVGCLERSRHCLEPSIDCQEGVGRIQRKRHGLEPSADCPEGIGHF